MSGDYRGVDSALPPSGGGEGVTSSESPPIGFPGARELNPDYPYLDADDLLFAAADLFASDPVLAKEVFDLGAGEHTRGKRFPFFHYLFIDASAPALGTKYTVCGYRCRTPEERQTARRAFLGKQVL